MFSQRKNFVIFQKNGTFLNFQKRNPPPPSLIPKTQKTKKIHRKLPCISEMELSSPNIIKNTVFSQKNTFVIFPKTEPSSF